MIGSYLHEPLLVDPRDLLLHEEAPVVPWVKPFMPSLFARAYSTAIELLPALQYAEPLYKIHGIFSFTPDGYPILGEDVGHNNTARSTISFIRFSKSKIRAISA